MVRPLSLKKTKFEGYLKSIADFVEHKNFIRFITALIILNAITLGMETSQTIVAKYGVIMHAFDRVVLAIFIIELGLKMALYRAHFFRAGWNVFDFVIVGISLAPQGAGLSILRGLRVLRLFRLITVVPQMRKVVGALLHAVPGMGAISGVLLVLLYVAAVLATHIFGAHPDPALQENFGSLSKSMFTMFQLMTLEGWPDIAAPAREHFPYAWMFFVPFIIVTTFAVLNLFIGIIVDALHIVKEEDIPEDLKHEDGDKDIRKMLESMQKDIKEIKKKL
jgi:voltage-gated sodium channel